MTGLVQAIDRLGAGNERHGPLPIMLTGLTVLTGMVDAVSYLQLGHVFVANMTGNVIFLGFAVGGATEFSVVASLAALAAFFVGAFAGGRIGSASGAHRGRLMAGGLAIETFLVAASLLLSLSAADPATDIGRYGLIILLGLAMGVQNAVVRRLAVPDLTTTVLTLTFTGLAADGIFSAAQTASRLRRLTAILAMFAGAAIGSLILLKVSLPAVLAAALVLLLAIGLVAYPARLSQRAWTTAK